MFIYLAKKVSIPNNLAVACLAWENSAGWLAAGGGGQLLKLLRLDYPQQQQQQHQNAASSSLSVSQTLEGHTSTVCRAVWNNEHSKLTTADASGLIIVWVQHKGMWYEEMINDRSKSVVADMRWNKDGSKICIAYEDGTIIIGSVDGNRILGKDLGHSLTHVLWSPDARYLLFASRDRHLQLYDATGNHLTKLPTIVSTSDQTAYILSMEWYDGRLGYMHPSVPCLAIAFSNGKLQLSRSERDSAPIAVDTSMKNMMVKWNHNGAVLAVGGTQHITTSQGEEKDVLIVQLYTPYGQYLRYLKVPGTQLAAITWEHDGLRLALAVDSYIYFANLRPDYRWCALPHTMCYTYLQPVPKANRFEQVITFWNHVTGERHTKVQPDVLLMASYNAIASKSASTSAAGAASANVSSAANNSYALIITKSSEDLNGEGSTMTASTAAASAAGGTTALLCNSIGTTLKTYQLPLEIKQAALTQSYAVLNSTNDALVFWNFGIEMQKFIAVQHNAVAIKAFHIDRPHVVTTLDGQQRADTWEPSPDPILAMDAKGTAVVVARASGAFLRITLPTVSVEVLFTAPLRAHSVNINCDGTKLAVVDMAGVLRVYSMTSPGSSGQRAMAATEKNLAPPVQVERKDVWNLMWSLETPDLLAVMEKNRLYVIRGSDPEEPLSTTGYICSFADLQLTIANLDDVIKSPEQPALTSVSVVETKSLRDTKNILAQVGLPDAVTFVESNSHARLWKAVFEAAMMSLDFQVAHKACVRSLDYASAQYIKRVQKIDDRAKQRAEITAYFGQTDVAEKMYLDMDRKDLAVAMRMQHGDYFRVVQLAKANSSDDHLIEKCWNAIGEHYFDQQKWTQAITYFSQARNFAGLVECYYFSEDFAGLEKLVYSLPDNSVVLKDVGHRLATVGMCEEAVAAFVKAGDARTAVDVCVRLNQWDQAVALAEANNVTGVNDLFSKHATNLLTENKLFDAVLLYRKANQCHRSAQILLQQALKDLKDGMPPAHVKKVFVLAALEVERFHTLNALGKNGDLTGSQTIVSILNEDKESLKSGARSLDDSKLLDTPWMGAEAVHFFILAQRQLYDGQYSNAVRTAQYLKNYEEILDPFTVYALIAVAALKANAYATCSRAFIRLEALCSDNEDRLQRLQQLAVDIFTKHPPLNSSSSYINCSNCNASIDDSDTTCHNCQMQFPVCIATGRPIVEYHHYMCATCKHRAIESEIEQFRCCPLCHTAF